MKRILLIALLFAVYACAGLTAQNFSLVTGREAVTSLDGLWRFHTGDNPAWANPNFDDSQWPLLRSDESWTAQGYPAFNGYAWYRFRIETPGEGKPLDLLLPTIVNGYQVYANGKLIGSAGSATPTGDPVFHAPPTVFRLPTGDSGIRTIQIALRVWTYRLSASWFGAGTLNREVLGRYLGDNQAGNPALLSNMLHLMQSDFALHFVNEYGYGLFAALAGLAILGLFLLRPTDKEYLWFSVLLLAEATGIALHLTLNLGRIPFPLWRLLGLIAGSLSLMAALVFFSIILHARRSMLWWIVCIAVAVSPLTAALIYFQWTGVGISFAIDAVCRVPAYVWIIASLLVAAVKKDMSARLLFVPVTLSYGIGLSDFVTRIAWQISGSLHVPSVDIRLFSRPFPLYLANVIDYIFILALLIFLMRRFSLARKEEDRLAAEFEAARGVQSLLIHAVPPATPGFAVEHTYLPASEVGGDFFQVLPADDGSLLIVVGDVSGKGLTAAMTVSVIVGALRGCTLRAPAGVLDYLNRVLHGQISGLVTCCAIRIAADGTMTIANAGHLSPYRNGEELACAGGLPLGVSGGGRYEEADDTLAPGDRLTFVSDGVVEATNARRELYGFERTRAISNQSAVAIAETAQRWGQEDDITVLSVTLTAKLQEATA